MLEPSLAGRRSRRSKAIQRPRTTARRAGSRAIAAILAGVAGVALAACGESSEPVPEMPDLTLVEELRLGVVDEPAHEQFGRISGVAIPDSDVLWVLDRAVPELRRFASDGTHLGTHGGRGEGPGEFESPTALVPAGEDGVVVWDPGNSRLSWFDGEGDFVRSAPVPSGLVGGSEPLLGDTLGRLYVLATHITEDWDRQGMFPRTRIRITPDGTIQDSVPVPRDNSSDGPNFVIQTSDGSITPFPITTWGTLDIGGEPLFARSDRYAIIRGSPDAPGDTLIRFPMEQAEVPPVELEQLQGWLDYFRRSNPDAYSATDRIPDLKPIFHYVRRDTDGRIWVRIHVDATLIDDPVDPADRDPDSGPPLNYRERTVYHVWTPDGEPVGRLALPRGARMLDARGDRVWLSESGPVGEPQVVRYRMEAG